MQSEATRTAFTLSLIHQRRDQHRITSVSVLQNATRVFLGLENGVLEEHSCFASTAAGGISPVIAAAAGGFLVLRLLAEKRVFSKQAVTGICAAEAAARLVCLSEEGQVALVSLETFAVVALPTARNAVAIAVQHTNHLPVLLAVAVKHTKGRSKVLVMNILPGANVTGGHQPAVLVAQVTIASPKVLDIIWAGKSILVAVSNGYYALTPVQQQPAAGSSSSGMIYQSTVLADHLHEISPMLGSVPDLGLGLMLWEENMVLVTDATGAAVREPLQLPMVPLSLTSAGMFLVALCDDGIHVFDRTTSREVQHIDFAHDDAYVRMQQRLPTAADDGGRAIVVATTQAVFRLEPIAVEQQVRELLKRKRFSQALDLISALSQTSDDPDQPAHHPDRRQQQQLLLPQQASIAAAATEPDRSRSTGAAWQQIALAQAGLLLLLDCEFESGLEVLEGLPTEVWQPCQLFGLFPGITARWSSKVPDRSYWGLHGHHIPDLQQLVSDFVELKAATAPRQQQQQQQQQGQTTLSSSSSSPTPEVEDLIHRAKTAIAGYLSKVRSTSGDTLLDGIDTLLLQLLCDVRDAAAVEALVSSSSNAAEVSAAAAALRGAGRWHALGLLLMNAGQAAEALGTWQALAAADLQETPSPTGAVAAADGNAAAVAVAAAAAAMAAGPDRVSADLLLSSGSLRWLLLRDAAASLAVLEARSDLDTQEVIKLLQEFGHLDLQWQYLYHQVHHNSSSSSQLHTQLATVLIAALAPFTGSSSSSASAAPGEVVSAAQLAAMAHQLPLLFTPNVVPASKGAAAAAAAAGGDSSRSRTLDGGFSGASVSTPRFSGFNTGITHGNNSHHMSQSPMSPGAVLLSPHNMLLSRQQSREPSVIGAGIPSAFYFAASMADINKREKSTFIPHRTAPAATAAAAAAAAAQSSPWQQRPKAVGALAGQTVLPRAAAGSSQATAATRSTLSRRGTAVTSGQLLKLNPTLSGLDALLSPVSNVITHRGDLTKTQSNIAHMLLQHMQQEAGAAVPATPRQQQPQQPQPGGLRPLPAGYGPWPLSHDSQPAAATSSSSSSMVADQAAAAGGVAAGNEQQQCDSDAAAAAVYDKVLLLRCLLVYHLQSSLMYDPQVVLSSAQALPLYPEQALLHSRSGNHQAALALLALYPPRLVEGAINYCKGLASAEAWLALLELFLNPRQTLDTLGFSPSYPKGTASLEKQGLAEQGLVQGLALEPDYGSACRVLNAEGASLNPLRLLAALPADMPLHLAGELLGYVVCGLQHRRRYGQVIRHLERCRRLATHADLVEHQSARVFITDDTACNGCGRFIGSKVFYRYPSGVVVCSRCSGAVAAARAGGSTVPSEGTGSAADATGHDTWQLV